VCIQTSLCIEVNFWLNIFIIRVLQRHQLEDENFIDYMAALSSTVGAEDCLPAFELSGIALGAGLATVETGRFVPKGGIASVEAALVETIQSHGGIVYKDADVKGLVLEKSNQQSEQLQPLYRAVGVSAVTSTGEEAIMLGSQSVVSGLGVLCTYANLLPSNCISTEVRNDLAQLTEARPRIQCVFWLSGSSEDLGLKSTEYFEMRSQVDLLRTQHQLEEHPHLRPQQLTATDNWADSYLRLWSPSAMDPDWNKTYVILSFTFYILLIIYLHLLYAH
jgi:hypothetical protein